jgi:flagellar hook-basal body protein
MSLFGAMNTAISGLSAQSNAFGNISDNVANSQTVGYKRVDTAFIDYLTTSTASTNVPGAVVTRPEYVNNVEGTITQTDNTLALAVTGQGFFAVSKQAGVANNLPTFQLQQEYTRAGDFQMDKNGYLVNSAGLFLNGWPVTVDPTTGANVVNQNNLAPIQVSQTVFNPIPTTSVNLSANLPATPTVMRYTVAQANIEVARVDTITATATADVTAGGAIDSATAATAAAAAAAQAGATAASVVAVLNALGAGPKGSAAAQAGITFTITPTTTANDIATAVTGPATTTINAAAAAANPVVVPTPPTFTANQAVPISSAVNIYDSLGTMQTVTLNWVWNAANNWTLQIQGGTPSADCGKADVTFDPNTGRIANIVANGTDPGSVVAFSNALGNTAAKLTFAAKFGTTSQPVTLNLGTYGQADGITQFSGTEYNLRGLTQNGVPPGAFSSVSTATDGDIAVNYDNGQSRVIYRVPLITFNAPNALQRQDGQAFTVSQDSGGPLAETPSTNGAGDLLTQELESSNVDIATEFSKLIVAQRAYTANTKMITTADDMLQQTIDMKR